MSLGEAGALATHQYTHRGRHEYISNRCLRDQCLGHTGLLREIWAFFWASEIFYLLHYGKPLLWECLILPAGNLVNLVMAFICAPLKMILMLPQRRMKYDDNDASCHKTNLSFCKCNCEWSQQTKHGVQLHVWQSNLLLIDVTETLILNFFMVIIVLYWHLVVVK